ncbi:hypothetical protein STANM309S_04179 [Streptomyces tanashiensis]
MAVAPLARLPKWQVTVSVLPAGGVSHVPVDGVAVVKRTFAGRLSVRTTSSAAVGPRFRTRMV